MPTTANGPSEPLSTLQTIIYSVDHHLFYITIIYFINYYLFYELLFDLPLVTWNHGGRWAAQGAGAVGLVPGSWGRAAAEPLHGPVRVISPCTALARARATAANLVAPTFYKTPYKKRARHARCRQRACAAEHRHETRAQDT
jgi:hypothetical protein